METVPEASKYGFIGSNGEYKVDKNHIKEVEKSFRFLHENRKAFLDYEKRTSSAKKS